MPMPERLIDAEVAAVAAHRPALVFADIPALAFEVADALGCPASRWRISPGTGSTRITREVLPGFAPLVAALRAAYGRATLLLRLPLHGDLSAFPRIRDVPLVARRAIGRAVRTRRLGLPRDQRLVLLSFGGIGLRLRACRGWRV